MGIHFQEEILMDILKRLPMRSFLRFKCVSKFWGTLISRPYFKKKHLNHAKNDQNSQKLLIIQKYLDNYDVFHFYCSSLSSVQAVEDEQKLDWPSACKLVSCKVLCGCDGLVLLVVTDRGDIHFLLWNPSIRESIQLPPPESRLGYYIFGMGYDATSDDYKILAVTSQDSGRYSGIFQDDTGMCLGRYSGTIDVEDNVIAGLEALKNGLVRCMEGKPNAQKLIVESDNVIVVRYVNGHPEPNEITINKLKEIFDLLELITCAISCIDSFDFGSQGRGELF
ncbi:putative F-box protein At1g47790 [Lycium ferocissimum]|uniref:putative F-box protein At1g47790 n=1 Tax=Lycium ferocissimum TaxID=112874 RepID=UPI002815E154|nr:putative F-box protein At1g47790 [Lycium ferocissimum]